MSNFRESVISLLFKTNGPETIGALQTSTRELRKQMEDLGKSFAAGEVSADKYVAAQAKLEREYNRQVGLLEKLEAAQQRQAAEAQRAAAAIDAETDSLKAQAAAIDDLLGKAHNAPIPLSGTGPTTTADARAAEELARAQNKAAFAADAAAREEQHLFDVLREGAAMERSATAVSAEHAAQLKKAAVATQGATNKMAGFSQAGLQAGRVVQDFTQGGLAGVLNNIEGVTMALGGPAGVAGALTVLGTLAFVFRDQISEAMQSAFGKSIDFAKSRLESLQEEIKGIEDKPHKLFVDIVQLEDAKKEVKEIEAALAAVEELKTSQTKTERESGAAVNEAIVEHAEGGVKGVTDRLTEDRERELRDGPDGDRLKGMRAEQDSLTADKARLEAAITAGGDPEQMVALQRQLASLQMKLNQSLEDAANLEKNIQTEASTSIGKILNDARKGNGADQAAAQKALADRLRNAGQAGLADRIEGNSPAEMKANKEAAEDIERQARDVEAEIEAKKVKDAADKKAREADSRATANVMKDGLRRKAIVGLGNGKSREEVTDLVRKLVRLQLDEDEKIDPDRRAGVAEDVARKVDDSISNDDVDKAVAADKAKADKALKKTAADKKKGVADAQRARAQAIADTKKDLHGQRKAIADAESSVTKNTSIDEEAAAYDAQLRMNGVGDDRRRAMVAQAAGRRVRMANPQMDPMTAGTVGRNIARGAEGKVDDMAMRAANGGAVNVQQMIGITTELNMLARQTMMMTAANQRDIAGLKRQVAATRSNLPRARQ